MEDEGMMEEDAMMEDSMEKDDAMMEDDGSMMGSDTAVSVDVANFAYNPSTVTVKQGSEITFTNNDSVTHTVTANDGAFDSGNIAAGDMYTLDTSDMEPGEYAYYCTLHPNMTGTIVIE